MESGGGDKSNRKKKGGKIEEGKCSIIIRDRTLTKGRW